MYNLRGNSPFRMCGKDNIKVVGFVEAYLVQRGIEMTSDDYDDLLKCAEQTAKSDESLRNASTFYKLFSGNEKIKVYLKDLCAGCKYGFFESIEHIEEEPDDVYEAMFNFLWGYSN